MHAGAHTIGRSHCDAFANRLYNFNPNASTVLSLDASYAAKLKQQCSSRSNDVVCMDPQTLTAFDTSYYRNILVNRGLLTSNQTLLAPADKVKELVGNHYKFHEQFAATMVKMGEISVLTESNNEICANCKRRSMVEEIVVEGKVIKDNNEMADSFANWYEELWTFSEERRNKVDLNNLDWVRISTKDCSTLEREFRGDLVGYKLSGIGNLHDSIVMLNEIVFTVNKSRSRCPILLVKIDLEKAYDIVDWRVVMKIMEKMSFPVKSSTNAVKQASGKTSNWRLPQIACSTGSMCTAHGAIGRKQARLARLAPDSARLPDPKVQAQPACKPGFN
ncbi:peroxidase 5-like [Canna indica]|uniref:Peroxidase n=1 Tax=Canna indica TaxID=4628 RepID=A0AAQ3QF57_9LILI|nr:peroxidase 5-like [Canna indica]